METETDLDGPWSSQYSREDAVEKRGKIDARQSRVLGNGLHVVEMLMPDTKGNRIKSNFPGKTTRNNTLKQQNKN